MGCKASGKCQTLNGIHLFLNYILRFLIKKIEHKLPSSPRGNKVLRKIALLDAVGLSNVSHQRAGLSCWPGGNRPLTSLSLSKNLLCALDLQGALNEAEGSFLSYVLMG